MEFMWSLEHAHMIRAFAHCTLEMLDSYTHKQQDFFFTSEKEAICYSLRIKIAMSIQIWAVITKRQIFVQKQSMCYHNGLHSDQIWRVGLNFNWKCIYSLSPSKMKRNINNCTSIGKYKWTKPFHQKNAKNKYCSFKFLQFYIIEHSLISTLKNDIFSMKLILNTLSCHMCMINFTVQ